MGLRRGTCLCVLLIALLAPFKVHTQGRPSNLVAELALGPWSDILRAQVTEILESGGLDNLRSILQVIEHENYVSSRGAGLTEQMRMELKKFRVRCQYLRAFFVVLSVRHREPSGFDEFVKKLGKLKDSLFSAEVGVYSKLALRFQNQAAHSLLVQLNRRPEILLDLLDSFAPATAHNLAEFIRRDLNTALQEVEKSQLVGFDRYHDYRKLLRNYAQVLRVVLTDQALNLADVDREELLRLARDIHAEQSRMGEVLDQIQQAMWDKGQHPKKRVKQRGFAVDEVFSRMLLRLAEHLLGEPQVNACRVVF